MNEMTDGISVFDADGDDLGTSVNAGRSAVFNTILTNLFNLFSTFYYKLAQITSSSLLPSGSFPLINLIDIEFTQCLSFVLVNRSPSNICPKCP